MKRIIALVLVFVSLFAIAIPTMAVESEKVITPRYAYIDQTYACLSINSASGLSQSDANVYATYAGSIQINCRLQRYDGYSWSTVKSWTTTGGSVASLTEYWYVASGYTYRLSNTCYVYNTAGTLVETTSFYSNYVTY